MIDEDIKSQIVRDLVRRRSKSSIITELCESSGLKWDEAEHTVDEIENDNAIDIYSRQKPLLILIGSTVTAGGLILSGFTLLETINGLVVYVGIVPIPYPGNIIFFGIGLGMIIGGTRGVVKLLID